MTDTNKRVSIAGDIDKIILVRLFPNDDVLQAIWDTIIEYDIKAGVIMDGSGCLDTFKYQHFMENPQNTIFPEDVCTMTGPIEASIQGTIGMMDIENVSPDCPVWPLNFPDVPGMFDTDEQKIHMAGTPELKTGAPYVHAHCTCTNATRTVCGHLMPGTRVKSLYQEDEVPSHFTLILAKFKDMKLVFKYNELGGYHELVKE